MLTSATFGGLSGGENLPLVNLAGASVSLDVGGNGQNTTYSGVLSEGTPAGASLTKDGTGTTTLTASHTYTGPTMINNGTLQLGTGQAGQDGSIASTSGVTDNAALVYNLAGSQTVNYAIGGFGTVTKTGSGFLLLAATNSYSGGTIVNNGLLQLGNSAALGTGGLAADGGTLDLAGYSVTVASFSGAAGTVASSMTGSLATLTVNQASATTFGGTIEDGAGQVALSLEGGGMLTLSGTNTYTGLTQVLGGTLVLTSPSAIEDGNNLYVGSSALFFFRRCPPRA